MRREGSTMATVEVSMRRLRLVASVSHVYTSQEYADTLAAIGPVIHATYPNVKLFGSENMLAIECGGKNGFDPYWDTAHVMSQSAALSQMGMWAVHGYSDGVLARPTSQMSTYWTSLVVYSAATA